MAHLEPGAALALTITRWCMLAAIIGAGISGLTAGKSLTDWGLPYTCFEASDDIGGNWYFGNPNSRSSAYQSLHIDTYRDSVSFRDMPMGEDYPDYAHHEQIRGYINDYAEAFSLRERIRFDGRGRYDVAAVVGDEVTLYEAAF